MKVLTKEEREIIINKTDADKEFTVYVSTPSWYRKLTKMGYKPYQEDTHGAWFRVPVNKVSVRGNKPKAKRQLSQAHLDALKEGRKRKGEKVGVEPLV